MKKKAEIFIRHILDEIEKIKKSLVNISKESFMKDSNLKDATVRRIEIIGEAVKNLPADYKNRHKNIPWKDIAGMRDKLMHHYFGVDFDKVWEVVQKDVPILKKEIEIIIRKGNKNNLP